MFLASDYVRTFTDLATMEGANEAARRAVNAVLDASGTDSERCEVWRLSEPGGVPFKAARAGGPRHLQALRVQAPPPPTARLLGGTG